MNELDLSLQDKAMLEGEMGPAKQAAISVIVRMAEICHARHLLDISSAHIDSSIYTGNASLMYAEKMVQLGARVAVPSTLNVSSVDELGWKDWSVPKDFAEKSLQQMRCYVQMGCIPSWTCAPYQTISRPAQGEHIAWSESNAVAFANSVLGARTNCYPGFLDICMAITGRAPAEGLHLTSNRAAELVIDLRQVPSNIQTEEAFYPVLGYLMGSICQSRIPVIDHLASCPREDDLKSLGAAGASSGGVALFHIVGVTPEAPTLQSALQGKSPQQTVEINGKILQEAYHKLNTTSNEKLDVVFLGCPHLSLEEFGILACLVEEQHCHPDVLFFITTSRSVYEAAKERGYLSSVNNFGARISVDTCVLISPILRSDQRVMMTNSGKCAYYAPGKLGRAVHFGNMRDCVRSAISGFVRK